mmetsp:Transcript_59543/g.159530  ORF Transcript_59543/g.159530 Transcript_59543/m.159530 type:complete len:300 (-) Transcript_59543:71-970(-)
MASFLGVFAFLLIPAAVLMLSAVSSLLFKIPQTVESGLQHFAGGGVLSATATELVPEMLKPNASIPIITLGFSLGVAMLLAIRKFFPEAEEEEGDESGGKEAPLLAGCARCGTALRAGAKFCDSCGTPQMRRVASGRMRTLPTKDLDCDQAGAVPLASIVPTAIDFLCDGMLMGLSFSAGASTGVIMVLSIALEMSSVGAATFAGMLDKKVPNATAMAVMAGLAACIVSSGAVAYLIAASIAGTAMFYGLLAFGIAACLWLACEDLLSEAHESVEDMPVTTAMFFVGFLLPIILDKLGG